MKNFTFKINENNYSVKIVSHENNTIDLEVNGTSYSVKLKEEIKTLKTPTLVRKPSKAVPMEPIKVSPSSSSKTKITAPIPGIILSLNVKVGDTIKENDALLVLEAMKMENSIVSEKSGVVTAIHVKVGQQVLQGEVMIELE
ncbi:MAG: biotin/lipoyl-binding protein [Flavobacteriales bacterium]|nr:biotin/lipoyl-binding protein [Flavobacteriia bacterium]NCP06756.1 biotin/lipoyl-binding protein [Flavobacteriales bacterium]PIV94741.1 MAG: acetyl-CoA carboxylase biotin carboxyl carrier protein subunit [Flavobacteriaceae bacterium CG17_big_fil_post_rev_8_21_14_2_50_33_15]PIY13182.1 MAG: acetyl-CoA carboxylase biotin carboxyl carrier protein subunit [Flavobacteriaceae bacterium CG_4_10_14_3_um_filter_33_47]PJB18993.1 MAG: acetyl-CoA carboxylase biotin carboxyl carrier protein subunit [Flavo